jgi:hypothetical protein
MPSLVGTATGTNSCTVPAHNVGDYIIIFAFNDASTTVPTVPAGFTSLRTQAGTTCAMAVGFKVATATNDTSGTWTNATEVACSVYTGKMPSRYELMINSAVTGNNSAASTTLTVSYPALTNFNGDGTSIVVAAIGVRNKTTNAATPPTGMQNLTSFGGSVGFIALHDSNGTKTSWGATGQTLTGTATGSVCMTVELAERARYGWDRCNVGRGALNSGTLATYSLPDDVQVLVNSAAAAHDQCATAGGTGTFYFEMTCVAPGTSDGSVGVEGTASTTGLFWVDSGFATPGAFLNSAGTQIGTNTLPNATAGQTIGIMIDAPTNQGWIKNLTTNSNWNGSATANPSTKTGGLAYGGTSGTIVYPMVGGATTGTATWIVNPGDRQFLGQVPTGALPLIQSTSNIAPPQPRFISEFPLNLGPFNYHPTLVPPDVPAAGAAVVSGTGAASGVGAASAAGTGITTATGAASGVGAAAGVAVGAASVGAATGGAIAVTATLDPAQLGPLVTLSNGNLTATSGGENGNSLATIGKATGKYYFEYTANSSSNNLVGLANASEVRSAQLGLDATKSIGNNFVGQWAGTDNSGSDVGVAHVSGHVYGMAIDIDGHGAWVKDITAASGWNSSGTANPATGTGAVLFTALTGKVWPAIGLPWTPDQFTFNFGATAYAATPPAGFGNWSTDAVVAVGMALAVANGVSAGLGTATASGSSVALAQGAASGTGAASAASSGIAISTGSAAGTGAAIGRAASQGAATGLGIATGVGASLASATGATSGTGAASATGRATALAQGAATGIGAATATGLSVASAQGAATGVGTATGSSSSSTLTSGTGAAAGTSTVAATGQSVASAQGQAAGVGAASASATGINATQGQASGLATALATGFSLASSTATSAGIGSAQAAGTGINTAQGAATGVGAATATGFSLASAKGSAAGTGAAAGTGFSQAVSQGAAAGTGIASGIGIARIAAQAAGIGAANGIGAALVVAQGQASGVGTAAAFNASVNIGSAAGVGSAQAVGLALFTATGTAAGIGAATARAAGQAKAAGTGSAAGVGVYSFTATGAAAGIGSAAAQVAAQGAAAGVGTATGISAQQSVGLAAGVGSAAAFSVAGSFGQAAGVATATAFGTGLKIAQGAATGVGAAVAAGTGIKFAQGNAAGVGSAAAPGIGTNAAFGQAAGTSTANAISRVSAVSLGTAQGTGTAQAFSSSIVVGVGYAAGYGIALGSIASPFPIDFVAQFKPSPTFSGTMPGVIDLVGAQDHAHAAFTAKFKAPDEFIGHIP